MIPENSAAEVIGVYTLLPEQKLARELAHALVREKLAACVNVGREVTSFYEWDGKIGEEREIPVFIKTARRRFRALEEYILEFHPYQCPCLMAFSIADIHAPFADWVAGQVRLPEEDNAQSGS